MLVRLSVVAIAVSCFPALACPDGQHDQCVKEWPWPASGCALSLCLPNAIPPIPQSNANPTQVVVPLPPEAKVILDQVAPGTSQKVEKLGQDTLTTAQKAGGDTIRVLTKAGGDTIATLQKAGEDATKTVFKAAGDATATYVKGWRDVAEQEKRSFNDAVDAGRAAAHFAENQAKADIQSLRNAEKRFREGKVIDSMWGIGTEPLQSGEDNFFKATQESEVINAAAGTAAAVYGGPAGAAAYAAWSTYKRTGNADLALRAGLLAAATSEMGSSVAQMPSGTTGEILKKAAMAGAAGGIAVAASGGDEQAIKDGFLKSAGAVLIQGASTKLQNASPEAKDLYDTAQCVSARDVDCLSKTTWARDAKGKMLYDANGNPRIDTSKLDPQQYVGKWTQIDPESSEGKAAAIINQASKLPKSDIIPILKNKWVITSTLGKDQAINYGAPTVVLSYVGDNPPFKSSVDYDSKHATLLPVASQQPAGSEPPKPQPSDNANLFADVTVTYYVKSADGDRVALALQGNAIPFETQEFVGPKHDRALSNALICGPGTPVQAVKAVATALIKGGVDLKYIGTKSTYDPKSLRIVNLLRNTFTVNYPNITLDQVAQLQSCPSSLKNK